MQNHKLVKSPTSECLFERVSDIWNDQVVASMTRLNIIQLISKENVVHYNLSYSTNLQSGRLYRFRKCFVTGFHMARQTCIM